MYPPLNGKPHHRPTMRTAAVPLGADIPQTRTRQFQPLAHAGAQLQIPLVFRPTLVDVTGEHPVQRPDHQPPHHQIQQQRKPQRIAEKLKYESTQSFSKMFKKHTGITPGQFRKSSGI